MTNLTTLLLDELITVTGGIRGQSREQVRERAHNLCNEPDPITARLHYDKMVDLMPDGVWPRTVKAIGELCGWPVPEGARNAKPIGPT